MISKDGHVVWSVPVSVHEMAKRFAVGQVLREKAARRREKAHGSEAIRAMPDQLHGKQLSSFLRNGDLLCGAFQTNRCTREESLCSAAHRCAVVCKSGRVCGGHPRCHRLQGKTCIRSAKRLHLHRQTHHRSQRWPCQRPRGGGVIGTRASHAPLSFPSSRSKKIQCRSHQLQTSGPWRRSSIDWQQCGGSLLKPQR